MSTKISIRGAVAVPPSSIENVPSGAFFLDEEGDLWFRVTGYSILMVMNYDDGNPRARPPIKSVSDEDFVYGVAHVFDHVTLDFGGED